MRPVLPSPRAPARPRHETALETLLEQAANGGTWVFHRSAGNFTFSPASRELLELAPGQNLNPAQLLRMYAAPSRDLIKAALAACLSIGASFDEEAQVNSFNGKPLWLRIMGEALPDANGDIIGMQGVLQDLTDKKRAESQARAITMRLGITLSSIAEPFATLDRDGRFTYLNSEAEALLGRGSIHLLGRMIWEELDIARTGRLRLEMYAACNSGKSVEFEEYYAALGRWLELRAYPFEDGIAIYFRDISNWRESREQLLLLQTSIARLNDIVIITEAGSVDFPGPRMVFVNDAFVRHTGYTRAEALEHTPRILQGKRTERSELDRIRAALQKSQPVRAELINYRRNGEPFWMELEIVPVEHSGRGVTHWVSVARDITERKASEDEIEHLAFYDALTQLPNRQLLMERLQKTLSVDDDNTIGALMFIDLDNFKVLNDTLGHARGDMLLVQAGMRLAASSRLSDTVARLGGDEFVVMLENLGEDMISAVVGSRAVAEKILEALSEPYDLAGHQHHSTCSIGITLFRKNREGIGELLKQADLAMYQAKASGRNTLCFFDPSMQAAATANAAMGLELRQGLRQQDFVLHYQPQVGRKGMFGVEALIRWQHPERGIVYPNDFIHQAEETGLILPLGQWVIDTACAQLARWALHPATADLSIAVNVSARQFRHPEFVDMVMRILNEHSVRADRLKLELTESLLATDMDETIAKMGTLKRSGVTLSIDDFGMGYSALSYLKHLPLDQLKIDRTFVKDILSDPNDAAIARTIIGLAQSLGLSVVAEGVETEAQRDLLLRFGCECYQGHLFCRALPIEELEIFMHGLSA